MSIQGETPEESPVPNGALVVPRHGGGRIRRGSQKGNTPGSGRLPSVIRESARKAWDERIPFLTGVIDGEMVRQQIQAPGALEPVTILRSADIDDRLKAMRELRAAGLGTIKEISVEQVRDRLAQQIRTITDELPRLFRAMGEGASTTVGKSVLPLETPEQVGEALLKMIEAHWT